MTIGDAEKDRLIEHAIRNAWRLSNARMSRASHASHVFGIGFARATALCCYYDMDPDEQLPPCPSAGEVDHV